MTRVKICGITRVDHALAALEAGADMLGFIFYPPSHRYVNPVTAGEVVRTCRSVIQRDWRAVGVFVNVSVEALNDAARIASLDLVQLAGDEEPAYCAEAARPVIKVVRVDASGQPAASVDPSDWGAERILLDTHQPGHFGGTGQRYDWEAARPYARDAILAGGLAPQNVADAIRLAQPWGLDVSSGVERNKIKDPELIRSFLREVRRHDAGR